MAAEISRAREVYRYHQPHDSSESLAAPESSATEVLQSDNPLQLDAALTAFAQLIALRFQAQRAVISLTDHEYEHFIAESTSDLDLLNANSYARNQFLSARGAKVPKKASLCQQTLDLSPHQNIDVFPASIFLDLQLEEKLRNLSCVAGAPYLRFYCGVPLTNNNGVNIGSVYVVDDTPRAEISLEKVLFLVMMAATAMNHLENVRVKEEAGRVTRMSQALHAFIEGDGTMLGDWKRLRRYNLLAGKGIGYSWESNKVDAMKAQKSMQLEPSPPRHSLLRYSSPPREIHHLDPQHSPVTSYFENFRVPPQMPTSDDAGQGDASPQGINGEQQYANSVFSNLLHATFSRASNLVREGMEIDGAVYFDAPLRFYQGRSTLEVDRRDLGDPLSESGSSSADENYNDAPYSNEPATAAGYDLGQATHSTDRTDGLRSDALGFSTQKHSSLNGQTVGDTDTFAAMDPKLLRSLVKRYPEGKLFSFDSHGSISAKKNTGLPPRKITTSLRKMHNRDQVRKRAEITRLLAIFPKACHILFVPLYDSTSGCFIGSFAWSTSHTRIFSTENDLSYLIAFGHSVMTEVSRLNALSADLAKDQFINNVSHELRSPLHGILASVEFLEDTSMDAFQRSLVGTVDKCGRILLDTVEHILDFSKIKMFGQHKKHSMGVVAELDISEVIEEVLESVCTGFEFNGLLSQGLADMAVSRMKGLSTSDSTGHDLGNNVLDLILDIDFREQWKFPTVSDTWRRLTMNLFGNALKYTTTGWINVKLEAHGIPNTSLIPNDGNERTMVFLTVSDTGKGISSDFMKTKLFMPFSQEDVTMPGTGIGMSIVKQIVDNAGGTIEVQSSIGNGTAVKVSLPLETRLELSEDALDKLNPSPERKENLINAVRRRAHGRTVALMGFNIHSSTDYQPQALASLETSMKKYVQKWFGLSIVDNIEDDSADILIAEEPMLLDLVELSGNGPSSQGKLLIILCSTRASRAMYASSMDSEYVVEFVSKPCGPRRLAQAILNCLDKEFIKNATKEARLDTPDPKQVINSLEGDNLCETTQTIATDTVMAGGKAIDLQSTIQHSLYTRKLYITPKVYKNVRGEIASQSSINVSSESDLTTSLSPQSSLSKKSDMSNVAAYDSLSVSLSSANDTKSSSDSSNADLLGTENLPTKRPKMLLVEDNPINMMLLSAYMKKKNWDFETGENGLLALQKFQNRPQGFDIVFMDISMPIMTGYESTREIRKLEIARRSAAVATGSTTTTRPPALIIAITGASSRRDRDLAFASGVDIFMTKPVRFSEVERVLKERFGRGGMGIERG